MKKVMILSGAGLSAESGIRTFRDFGGYWDEYDIMEVCSVEGYMTNRQRVLDFYDMRRTDLDGRIPNDAHEMICRIKDKYNDNITVMTQNVDDLLEKCGCSDVIHLHGKLTELKCESCSHTFEIGYKSIKEFKECPNCYKNNVLRHNVVMFGELAPEYNKLYKELYETELVVIIGTSGTVLPIERIAMSVKYSVLNNLEELTTVREAYFNKVIYSKASIAAPQIENIIDAYFEDFIEEFI